MRGRPWSAHRSRTPLASVIGDPRPRAMLLPSRASRRGRAGDGRVEHHRAACARGRARAWSRTRQERVCRARTRASLRWLHLPWLALAVAIWPPRRGRSTTRDMLGRDLAAVADRDLERPRAVRPAPSRVERALGDDEIDQRLRRRSDSGDVGAGDRDRIRSRRRGRPWVGPRLPGQQHVAEPAREIGAIGGQLDRHPALRERFELAVADDGLECPAPVVGRRAGLSDHVRAEGEPARGVTRGRDGLVLRGSSSRAARTPAAGRSGRRSGSRTCRRRRAWPSRS